MRTSFIESDVATLREHFEVDHYTGHGFAAVLTVARRAFGADVSISWFASVYTFFMVAAARVRRRPSVVMLGGVDTARVDSIGYGIWRSAWRRPLLRWALRNASLIFAVDASLARALAASSGMKDLQIAVLPTGYDPSFWIPGSHRVARVACVASCATHDRVLVKGIDIFVEAARRLSRTPFVLVGTDPSLLHRYSPPSNLEVVGAVGLEALRLQYQLSSVYCQPSRHEGLPNALCEAMLCECTPVATDAGGMRDAIGECGYIVDTQDVEALVESLIVALEAQNDFGSCARERVAARFPLHTREARLVSAVQELLHA